MTADVVVAVSDRPDIPLGRGALEKERLFFIYSSANARGV